MEDNQLDLENKYTKNEGFITQVNVSDILNKCRQKWWWFVISIILCMGYGLLYYLKHVPTYKRSELVLVITSNDGVSNDAGAVLSTIGLNDINPRKLNELIGLTSPQLMIDVTRRLHLNINYTEPLRWRPRPLYGPNLPIEVTFPGWDDNLAAKLKLELLPGGKVKLLHVSCRQDSENMDVIINYAEGDTIQTPLGEFGFKANPLYVGGPIEQPMTIDVARSGVYATAMALTSRVQAEIVEQKSDVISLSIIDPVPERAVAILDNIVSIYNENWTTERANIAEATSRFIEERLGRLEQELGSVEGEIAGFKASHLMMDAESAASNYMTQANRANEQVVDLSNRLAMTRYVRDFLAAAATSNSILPTNTGLANVNIETQITEYNRTLFERNQMAANSSASNPLVAELDTRLEALRRALLQSLDNHIAALNTQLSSAQRTESISTGRMAASPGQARVLLEAERRQKVKESLYLFLLQKREESELSQNLVANKIRVISQPTGPAGPLGPYRNNILSIAFIIGLLIPLGIIFITESFNNRVRHRKDLEVLKMPFAGELPDVPASRAETFRRIAGKKEKALGLLVQRDNLDFVNEAFRVLRTNIELMARRDTTNGAFIIGITSLYPGSGKTFISMNLGAALAIKGGRVLLIDMDLRRTSLSQQLLPQRHDHGLVDYLVGMPDITVDNIVEHNINDIEGLDIIPAGIVPPNPSELIADPRLAELMDYLKQQYDFIIFDCPPAEIVADALIINNFVNMTLFIVRAGLFRRAQLPRIQEMYDTHRYNSMAVVLNSAPENTDGYGYGYRYGAYRRRYRYGHNPNDKKK